MKICSCCKIEKEQKEFGKNKNKKDGLWVYCKKCVSQKGKDERAKRPEYFKEKSRKFRKNNPEKIKLSFRKHYLKYRDDKIRWQHEYSQKNKEEIKKRNYIRHRTTEFREKAKKYREKVKERTKVQQEAHKMVLYALKLNVLKKSETCEICKDTLKLQGHHKDYNKPLDVQWLCKKCHYKQDKLRGN
jgi:hypothetical protein